MNSKEIELVLAARLEGANAEKDALQVGSAIGSAIENSMQGLGTRLAERFADEFKSKIQQLDLFKGASGGGTYLQPQAGSQQFGDPNQMSFSGMGGPAPRTAPLTSAQNEEFIRSGGATGGGGANNGYGGFNSGPWALPAFNLGLSPRARGFATTMTHAMQGSGLGADAFGGDILSQAEVLDEKLRKYQLYATQKKRNPGTTADQYGLNESELPGLKKDMQAFAETTARTLATTDFKKSLDDLTAALKGNEQTIKAALQKSPDQRTESERELVKKYEERNHLQFLRENGQSMVDQFNRAADQLPNQPGPTLPWYRNPANRQGMAMGMATLGESIGFLGNFGISNLRGAAGTAQANNMEARDMLSGDYNSVMATAMLGGYDALKSSSRVAAGADVAGNLLSGIGQTVVGGLTAETGIGAVVGLNGVRQTLGAVRDINEFDMAVANKMNLQKNLAYSQNQEYIDLYGKARANVQMAYKDAQGLGSDRYSQFLTGYRSDNLSGIYAMNTGMETGLSRAEISSGIRTVAAGMGAVYNGQNSLDDYYTQTRIAQLQKARGEGLTNAESIASAFFRGGYQDANGRGLDARTRALDYTTDAYRNMRGMGIEESSSVALLNTMAGRATMSTDAGANAQYLVGATANLMAANPSINNMQGMNMMSRMMGTAQDNMNTGNGIMGIARYRAIQEFERKTGKKLTAAQRYAIQIGGMGESMAAELGLGKDAVNTFNQINEQEGVQMYTNAVGGSKDLGQTMYAREVAGARDSFEMIKGGQLLAQTKKAELPEAIPGTARTRAPGAAEQNQETRLEVDQLVKGVGTLKEGFAALEHAAKSAATRLNEVAGRVVLSSEEARAAKQAEDERNIRDSMYSTNPMANLRGDWAMLRKMTGFGSASDDFAQNYTKEQRKAQANKENK